MSQDDWGIVVGIRSYPALGDLDGPTNDANAFWSWLTSEDGGAVPTNQAFLVVTPRGRRYRSPLSARPKMEEVRQAAEKLHLLAGSKPRWRLGRRLYLYMAGHAYAPLEHVTALLMANATETWMGPSYYWPCEWVADWFYVAGFFDEILLFLDCCRTRHDMAPLAPLWGPKESADFAQRVKRFYAYATKWTLETRELLIEGEAHGPFTTALLAGLRGGACMPDGKITTKSLETYLRNNMQKFLPDALRQDPNTPKEPDLPLSDDFVLVTNLARPTYPVTIHLPGDSAGKTVQILDSRFALADRTIAEPPTWELRLPSGLYGVQILPDGEPRSFEVSGTGGEDVSF